MKRISIALVFVFLLILSCLFLVFRPGTDPDSPRYIVARTQPAGGFGSEMYDWGGAMPFQNGRVWVTTTLTRTNRHVFLYDLEKQKIEGELFNAGPVLANQDLTKLLCEGYASPVATFKQRVAALVNRLFSKSPILKTNAVETFWILNLHNGSAFRVGELSQFPGTSSRWKQAPGFRFSFNVPNNAGEDHSFVLCDLDNNRFEEIKFEGKLAGWWNEHEILVQDASNNSVLFDVLKREPTLLFSASSLDQTLKSLGLTNHASELGVFSHWNGNDYDFFFMAPKVSRDSGECALLKTGHANPALTVFSRDFKFGYLGMFDDTATHYVYEGESGATGRGGNGAVILRDLSSHTERVLVPPDNAGQYSLARIYSNTVIYWRNRVLWRVDINTTNSFRLFPPSGN
jgi:hypothetical protein